MSNKRAESECASLRQKLHDAVLDAHKQAEVLRELELKAKVETEAMETMRQELCRKQEDASEMKSYHYAREGDLRKRLTDRGAENKKLKQEVLTLRTAAADAVSERLQRGDPRTGKLYHCKSKKGWKKRRTMPRMTSRSFGNG